MAKIKVTTVDANHIKVEFRDYYTDGVVGNKITWYNRRDIEYVQEWADMVTVRVLGQSQDWQLSDVENLSNKVLQVDDIDGTTTWADLTTLAAQIAALMK